MSTFALAPSTQHPAAGGSVFALADTHVRGSELALLPKAVPRAQYGKALALAARIDESMSQLEKVAGPKAVSSGFDAWAADSKVSWAGMVAGLGGTAALSGLVTAAGVSVGGDADRVFACFTVFAGFAAAFGYVAGAPGRAQESLAHQRKARLETTQLEPVLTQYRAASPELQAVTHAALK